MGRKPILATASIAMLCLSAGMTGCAGNGNGLDANGRPLEPGSGGPPPLSADFESIQANIFTPICSVCHVGGGAPEGLRLDAANSYNLLVGVPSTEVPSILRVKPGDPDNSYIIQKLEGHAAVGAQMPFGGPYLSSATIAFIRQWITDGAQPASMTASNAPMAVVTTTPANNDRLDQPPPQIMMGFNQALDFTRVDANAARGRSRGRSHEPARHAGGRQHQRLSGESASPGAGATRAAGARTLSRHADDERYRCRDFHL
jgi:hypothetical protein